MALKVCLRRILPVWRHWTTQETRKTLGLAWPIALSLFLQQMIFTTSLAFAGHIREDTTVVLEAVGLSVSVASVTALTVGLGMCAALDTLASQAWGAKNYKKLGVYVQRAILILSLAVLFVLSCWFNIESILHLLHQPPCVVEYTVQYMQIAMLFIPALFLYTILQHYLQAQNIVYPFIVTGFFANVVNVLAHYLFLVVAGWGVRGAAAAVALAHYTLLFTLLIIIYVRKLHVKTWGGWSRESLLDWGQFARFGIPGFAMVFAEWGGFELGFILTGIVSSTQQTIYTLTGNWINILYMVPYSIQIASSIRVGNEIGAGNPKLAKKAFLIGLGILAVWVATITVTNLSLRSLILKIFTSNQDILPLLNLPMVAAAVFIALDHFDAFLGGVLRGLGRQAVGAVGNTVAFWIVGIPLGIGLVFGAELGALGYMIGLIVAAFLQMFAYVVVIVVTDWRKQSLKARRMADADDKGTSVETDSDLRQMRSFSTEDLESDGDEPPLALENDLEDERSPEEGSLGGRHSYSFGSIFGKDLTTKNCSNVIAGALSSGKRDDESDEIDRHNISGSVGNSTFNGGSVSSPSSHDEHSVLPRADPAASVNVAPQAEFGVEKDQLHSSKRDNLFSFRHHHSHGVDADSDDDVLTLLESSCSDDTDEENVPATSERQFLVTAEQEVPMADRIQSSETVSPKQPYLTQTTIVVRILTALFFVILLAGSVVLSQVYVYRPSVCDSSNATNTSANLTSSMTYHFNGTLVHIS